MNNKFVLESLAMDLKRVAIGYNRGSITMAKRFSEEALRRKQEINDDIEPYIKTILNNLDVILQDPDIQKVAESALMNSTLLQNYTQAYFKS